jgi:NitT/TauT family transport system permease protein
MRVLHRSRLGTPLLALLVFTLLLTTWQVGLLHALLGIQDFALARPVSILDAITERGPEIWRHSLVTFVEAAAGYVIGSVAGYVIAVAALHQRRFRRFAIPVSAALIAVPIVAVGPLAVIWFGSGMESKVAISVLLVAPTMTTLAYAGLSHVDQTALDLLATLSASERQVTRELRIPAGMPLVFTALKLGIPLALIGAMVTDLFGAVEGLGLLQARSLSLFDQPVAWATIVIASGAGLLVYLAVVIAERSMLPWHGSVRS